LCYGVVIGAGMWCYVRSPNAEGASAESKTFRLHVVQRTRTSSHLTLYSTTISLMFPPSSPHTHSRLHTHSMGGSGKVDASIQAFFPPTPQSSPAKRPSVDDIGDGFTAEEIQVALQPKLPEPWQPPGKYTESDICDLRPGPKAVTFMGQVCNLFDVANTPKTPRSARGCVKLCVKDETGATTVRLWYAHHMPALRLGSLVSIWTTHSK